MIGSIHCQLLWLWWKCWRQLQQTEQLCQVHSLGGFFWWTSGFCRSESYGDTAIMKSDWSLWSESPRSLSWPDFTSSLVSLLDTQSTLYLWNPYLDFTVLVLSLSEFPPADCNVSHWLGLMTFRLILVGDDGEIWSEDYIYPSSHFDKTEASLGHMIGRCQLSVYPLKSMLLDVWGFSFNQGFHV